MKKNMYSCLIEYPDEDLYEDGELNDKPDPVLTAEALVKTKPLSSVEYKILQLWRTNKIVIAKWEDSE